MVSEKDKYIGYVEIALGIGDMIGPAMAGLFYEFFGFAGTFMTFGIMIVIGLSLSVMWIPSSLNIITSSKNKESNQCID
jgi:MFS family permease